MLKHKTHQQINTRDKGYILEFGVELCTHCVSMCILFIVSVLRTKPVTVWHSRSKCMHSNQRELLTYWVNRTLAPSAFYKKLSIGVRFMILTSADVTEDVRKLHVPRCFPTYNASLVILRSTSRSRCNTGPLFEESVWHRSPLKGWFII